MAKETIYYYETFTPAEMQVYKETILIPAIRAWITSHTNNIWIYNDGSIHAMDNDAVKYPTNIQNAQEAYVAGDAAIIKLIALLNKMNTANKPIPDFFRYKHYHSATPVALANNKNIAGNAYWKISYKIYLPIRNADVSQPNKYMEVVDASFSVYVQIYNHMTQAMKIVGIDYNMLPLKNRKEIASTKESDPNHIIFYAFDKDRGMVLPYYLESGRKELAPFHNKNRWTPACRLSEVQKNEPTVCFCNRNFTEEELRNIVIELRKKNGYGKLADVLFDIEREEKLEGINYGNFCNEINATMSKYNINTCIRKIYFISETYHETLHYRTTYEKLDDPESVNYSGGEKFRARGLIQITHDYNYFNYYSSIIGKKELFEEYINNKKRNEGFIEFVNRVKILYEFEKNFNDLLVNDLLIFRQRLSKEIQTAVDCAGWYWEANKINLLADDSNTFEISKKINGINKKTNEPNGYTERKKYTNDLKSIFDYESCINNK